MKSLFFIILLPVFSTDKSKIKLVEPNDDNRKYIDSVIFNKIERENKKLGIQYCNIKN